MEALKEIVEQNWLNPQPESDSVKTFLAASDQDLKAIRNDKLLVMMARLDRHRAESLMDGYVGPVTLELVEFYSIYTEHPSSLMELNNAARYLAFESNDPYRIRRACVTGWLNTNPNF